MASNDAFGAKFEDEAVLAKLRGLARRAADFGPVLDEIGASNVTETQQRFEDEVDPTGKKWKEHSDATKGIFEKRRGKMKSAKKRAAYSPRILRDRGDLYDSITHVVRGRELTVGTNRVYARIHQLGGQAGRGRKVTIPARPYLGVSKEGEKEIVHIIADHLGGNP